MRRLGFAEVVFPAVLMTCVLSAPRGPNKALGGPPRQVDAEHVAAETGTAILNDAGRNWDRVVSASLHTLKQVPRDAKSLTVEQVTACNVFKFYMAPPEACDALLRIVAIPEVSLGDARPGAIARLHDGYPAAQALGAVGMPAVRAIIAQIENGDEEIDDLKVRLFAAVITDVFGSTDAVAYLDHVKRTFDSKRVGTIDRILRVMPGNAHRRDLLLQPKKQN